MYYIFAPFFPLFSISLSPEEGGGSVELATGGREIPVNDTNLYDYVRMYANYRLVKTQEKALEVRYQTHAAHEARKNTYIFLHFRRYDWVYLMFCHLALWTH